MGEASPDGKNPEVLEDALLMQVITWPLVIQREVPGTKKSGEKGAAELLFFIKLQTKRKKKKIKF